MLNATALKNAILSEIANLTDAGTALQKLGTAIGDYIASNAVVAFTWVAVNPVGGAPDPVASASGGITTMTVALTPAYGVVDHNVAQAHLETECNAALSLALYNITDAGFSTAPVVFGVVDSLNLTVSKTSDSDIAIGELAENIIDWIKSQKPVAPCAGTHGVFVGTGTVLSIS